MLRRWYLPLAVLACAALLTVFLVRDGGTYSTRTVISFMLPTTTTLSPANGTTDSSVIAFAAAVVQVTNNGRPPARYSMDDAPFYGAGIRQGILVQLENSGNQWASTFNKAEIQIQVVGRTLDWVESRQQELISSVLRIADAEQAQVSVPRENRIQASVVPLTTGIEYISPSRTALLTAGAAMGAAAVIVGAWGSVMFDRLLSRRRNAAGNRKPHSPVPLVKGST
jgi:hypothetical protein